MLFFLEKSPFFVEISKKKSLENPKKDILDKLLRNL